MLDTTFTNYFGTVLVLSCVYVFYSKLQEGPNTVKILFKKIFNKVENRTRAESSKPGFNSKMVYFDN